MSLSSKTNWDDQSFWEVKTAVSGATSQESEARDSEFGPVGWDLEEIDPWSDRFWEVNCCLIY